MLKYNSYTKKNTRYIDKPNEDKIIIKNNLFIILDGVSRSLENDKYPNPSPSKEATKIIAETIAKYIKKNKRKIFEENPNKDKDIIYLKLIKDSIIEASKKAHDYNFKLNHKHKAGCVGIVMLIEKEKIYFAYIGDCLGMIIDKQNKKTVFTKRQTEMIDQHHSEFTTDEIRNEICNNFHHPYGYGVINGDQRFIKFLKMGIIKNNHKTIILSSDGMEKYLLNEDSNKLKKLSSKKMINDNSTYNDSNDDKSIIKITV